MSTTLEYWIGQAHLLSQQYDKPMLVVYTDSGGYQVCPASSKLGPMIRVMYRTDEQTEVALEDNDEYDFLK